MDPLRDVAELNRSCTEGIATETQLRITGIDAKKKKIRHGFQDFGARGFGYRLWLGLLERWELLQELGLSRIGNAKEVFLGSCLS